jgi:hypothetical protein
MSGLSRRWWPVAISLGFAVTAGVVLLAASILSREPTPPIVRSTASPTPSDLPESSSPTAEPTAVPPATLELEWTLTGAFGDEATGAIDALAATRWAGGMVAVGARYLGQFPRSGLQPPTRGGLIWLSADGRAWEDVTPPEEFSRVRLHEVFEIADGSLIVVGENWPRHWYGEDGPVERFWRSVDGRDWREVPSPLPAWRYVAEVERGPLGYVLIAHVQKVVEAEHRLYGSGTEIWFSEDGTEWELAWTPSGDMNAPEYLRDIDAGEDGFVAVGWRGWRYEAFTITSLNGRNWVAPAAPAHAGVFQVTARPPGWIIIAAGHESSPALYLESLEVPGATIWSSRAGIAWQQIHTLDLPSTEQDGATCGRGVQSLHGELSWLVASVRLSCISGNDGVEGFASPLLSLDALEWLPLPIPELSFDTTTLAPSETGLEVNGAIAIGAGLVLLGNSNGQAVFWLGTPP